MINLFRVLLGVLLVVMVAVASIPLLVLFDLSTGGAGWGLCPDGLGTCGTSYFSGFELFALLTLVLLLMLGAMHACRVGIRRLSR